MTKPLMDKNAEITAKEVGGTIQIKYAEELAESQKYELIVAFKKTQTAHILCMMLLEKTIPHVLVCDMYPQVMPSLSQLGGERMPLILVDLLHTPNLTPAGLGHV